MRNTLIIIIAIVFIGSIICQLVPFNWNFVHDLDDIQEEGRLSVLIESGEHGFSKDSAKVYGFQYEIIKEFSNSIGVELLVINQRNIKDGIEVLNKGRCDVLVSLRPLITDTVSKSVSLKTIISTRLMLVQRRDTAGKVVIQQQYDLDKDTIFVMPQSGYIQRINELSDELAADISIQVMEATCPDVLIKKVSEGEIKYSICPEYLAQKFLARYPDIDVSLPLGFAEDLSWMVNKESVQLKDKLNLFLQDYIGSPAYVDLYKKYFIFN